MGTHELTMAIGALSVITILSLGINIVNLIAHAIHWWKYR